MAQASKINFVRVVVVVVDKGRQKKEEKKRVTRMEVPPKEKGAIILVKEVYGLWDIYIHI